MRLSDGQALLDDLRTAGFIPTVAGWVLSEAGIWTLYLGVPRAERVGRTELSRSLIDAIGRLNSPILSVIDVLTTDADGPIARDLIRLRERLRGQEVGRFQVGEVGGRSAQEVYVYPKQDDLSPRDVSRAVFWAMMRHPAATQTAHVLLRNGQSLTATPTGLDNSGGQIEVHLLDPTSGQTRVVAADQISDIRFN